MSIAEQSDGTMTEPILTVLMSVYNGEPYLKDAVTSILNQTYSNFQFLIIDNASTDNSQEIIRDFKDSRIKLMEIPENNGLSPALNQGLEKIDTPLVARMDADDISINNRFEIQVAFMEKYPSVALLGTAYQTIDENGDLIAHYHPPTTHQEIIDAFTSFCLIAHSSVIFRYNPVKNLGGYPTNYILSQDLALWQRISLKYQVENLPIELVKIRRHSDQTPKIIEGGKKILIREERSLYKEALTHPRITSKAKRKGHYNLIMAELDYSKAIGEGEHEIANFSKVVKIFLYHPILTLKNSFFNLVSFVLGFLRNSFIYALKNQLHRILPYKILSKLHR